MTYTKYILYDQYSGGGGGGSSTSRASTSTGGGNMSEPSNVSVPNDTYQDPAGPAITEDPNINYGVDDTLVIDSISSKSISRTFGRTDDYI